MSITGEGGLSTAEAEARLHRDGPNELESDQRRSLVKTAVDVAREPMLLLLLCAGGLYVLLGDVAEAATLLVFVVAIIALEITQERRTDRALSALKGLSSPRALVIRDARRKRVPGREVVVGDLVVLSEGDRVPADGMLREGVNLRIDESLLTGESVAVRKLARGPTPGQPDDAPVEPGGDDQPRVFSGSLVVGGQGLMQVSDTGARSQIGRIGRALASVETHKTPLSLEVDQLVRRVAILGAVLCASLAVIVWLSGSDWVQAVLAGVALAMAILPEEFPVVLSVFMALGALRLSKHRVLSRRSATIETLGSTTVLCTDKTGTLTENRMRIAELDTGHERFVVPGPSSLERADRDVLPEAMHELVEVGVLSSARDPFDPMEIAFRELADRTLAGTEHLHDDWTLERAYPLSAELLSVAHAHRDPDRGARSVAAKGAPEHIFDLCHLDPATLDAMRERTRDMASRGLRVLAVARAEAHHSALPPEQHDFDFRLVGMVGLSDPVRQSVPAAVRTCHEAGIRVVMITGDYPETAAAIARDAGLSFEGKVVTGAELETLEDDAIASTLEHTSVVARAVPQNKLRIVCALEGVGHTVAMTGDGVNDAPALKAAHIGIAMGKRGTDVAREAAALVITDDDFGSIVHGVRLGRRIFDNLQKAMAYVIAVHLPIVGLSLVPPLMGLSAALSPVHIVFLELMIDPICSLAFEGEPEEPNLMKRRPRMRQSRLFTRPVLLLSILQGLSLMLAALSVYVWSIARDLLVDEARALSFTALVAGNVGLVLINRSWSESVARCMWRKNRTLLLILPTSALLLAFALTYPPAQRLFHFAPTTLVRAAAATAIGLLSLSWFELLKALSPGRLARARLSPR